MSDLCTDIRDAFSTVPRLQGCLCVETYDDEGTHDFFSKHTWDDIEINELRYHEVGHHFFTPQAFRYFYPAFLLAALTDPDEADVIVDNIVYHAESAFLKRDPDSLSAYRDFTDDQLDCLIAYLEVYQREHSIDPEETSLLISAIRKSKKCS